MKKNLLVAQSGGPTAAINATIAGAISRAIADENVNKVYGAVNGIKGVIEQRLIEIGDRFRDPDELELLKLTPSAALGSCRLKLKDPEKNREEFEAILETLRKFDIGYFVYTGGNDSMDTVYKLSRFIEEHGITDIKVMGAPKTVDNDLTCTDHTPGFGSAAKYIAATFCELVCDCNVYDIPAVTVVEVMGRNAGWLTAAAALANESVCGGPQLIYLPEVAFNEERFIEDVKAELEKHPAVVVAVSEGIKDETGAYAAEAHQTGVVDEFGHKYLAGTSRYLCDLVKEKIGCKTRAIELNLMQRCAAHLASATDITESTMLGWLAADRAIAGESGKMSTVNRIADEPYRVDYSVADISLIANKEKTVPREWINERGNGVTDEMLRYLRPLIKGETKPVYKNGIPVHIKLH